MIIVQTKHLTMKTRYYVNNNGQHSYQRAIPKDLRQYFDNKSNIVRKLRGTEQNLAAEIAKMASEDDKLFTELRGGAGQFLQREALARALLARFGLRPGEGLHKAEVPKGVYNQPHLVDIEHYLEIREGSGNLDEVDRLARQLLTNSVPLMLSHAIEIYLKHHERGSEHEFVREERARWVRILKVIGDVPIRSLTRETAHEYVEKGVRTLRLQRYLGRLRPCERC